MSIRRPGTRRIIGQRQKIRDLSYVRLNRQVHRAVDLMELDRQQLMAQGRTGDIGALCILYEKWGFRLPGAEGRIKVTLPWMRRRWT